MFRLYFAVIILTLLVSTILVSAEPAITNFDLGRYQLFQGNYTSIDLKRQQTSTHTGIFLVDTKTGKVKRYLNKIDEQGRYIETWVQTELPVEK